MAGFVLSNLTGLVRQILVSRAFGTSAELDAFNTASRLPDLLFSLFSGGALASAFVPAFTGLLTRGDRPQAWRLASSVLNLVFISLTILASLAALLVPALVRGLLAPGYAPEQATLTEALLRILLLSSVLFGVSGLLMGVLNAHQHFWLPALAPSMYWLGMIAGVLFLSPALGIFGLAWGAVLGAGLHLLVQLPALRGKRPQYSLTLGLREADLRRVARLMLPRVVGAAAVQVNFLVNTALASAMAAGSLSAIVLSWAMMTMPQVVIAQAISVAALPTFSAQAALGKTDELRGSFASTLRGILFLSIPASVGLVLLRVPLISLLFERGAFDSLSVELTAWALLWYGLGLVPHSVVEVASRAFYSLQDTRTPVIVGIGAMALNVMLSVTLAGLFAQAGWLPHGGLALANSLATALEMGALLWLLRRRLGGLEDRRTASSIWQTGSVAGFMGLLLFGWISLPYVQAGRAWLMGGGGVMLGAGAYWLGALLLGHPEARQLRALASEQIRRFANPS